MQRVQDVLAVVELLRRGQLEVGALVADLEELGTVPLGAPDEVIGDLLCAEGYVLFAQSPLSVELVQKHLLPDAKFWEVFSDGQELGFQLSASENGQLLQTGMVPVSAMSQW